MSIWLYFPGYFFTATGNRTSECPSVLNHWLFTLVRHCPVLGLWMLWWTVLGAVQGTDLHQKPRSAVRMKKPPPNLMVFLHLMWSPRAVVAAFALSPGPYCHTASSPHFVKWRTLDGCSTVFVFFRYLWMKKPLGTITISSNGHSGTTQLQKQSWAKY